MTDGLLLAGQVTSLKSEVTQFGAHDNRMTDVERQQRDRSWQGFWYSLSLESGISRTPSCARRTGAQRPPKHHRTVLVAGGFPDDTEKELIYEKLRVIFWQELGVKEWWAPGSWLGWKSDLQLEHERVAFLRINKGQMFFYGSKQL